MDPGGRGAAAHPAIGIEHRPAGGGRHGGEGKLPGQAGANAGQQLRQLVFGPAIAAVEHQPHRFAAGLKGLQGIAVATGQIAVDHQQHQIHPHRDTARQAGAAGGINFINAGGVDQLHPPQTIQVQRPGHSLLAAGAAMGHIGLQQPLTDQGIDQARLADPNTTEDGNPEVALVQTLELAIEQRQLTSQATLLSWSECELGPPTFE